MADSKINDNNFIPQPTTADETKFEKLIENPESLPPGTIYKGANFSFRLIKARVGRPKRLPGNVTVTTYQEASVFLTIPARPEGMRKVNLKIVEENGITLLIDWPEGIKAIEAIKKHFTGESNG